MIVTLDAFDLSFIAMYAERQHVGKVVTNATTKKHDENQTEFELHYVGAMGEYAVRKQYDVPLNMEVHRGGDNGVDVVINGWDCHVKTIAFTGPNPHYLMDDMDCFTAPIGICCQVMSPIKIKILGCIHRNDFAKKCEQKNFGYGDRLSVPVTDLKEMQNLFDHAP